MYAAINSKSIEGNNVLGDSILESSVLVTGLFSVWVVFMVVRGYLRGLWVSVFDLCGLLAGYVICFLWGQETVAFLESLGVAAHFALIGGFIGLFAVVNFLVAFIPKLVLAKALEEQGKLHWQGAGLGFAMGIVSGLVLVWCFNFVRGVVFLNEDEPQIVDQAPVKSIDKSLINTANSVVGKAAEIGARATGASEEQVGLLSALTKSPKDFVLGMQSVSKSPELTSFMKDSHVQTLMATDNIGGLVANYRFQALMHQEGMLRLRNLVEKNDEKSLQAEVERGEAEHVVLDRYIAGELSNLWRRMAVLKNDSRVKKILQDEEVKKLVAEKKPVALLANSKVQQLIKIVMEDNPDLATVDFTQFVDAKNYEENTNYVEPPKPAPIEIYRWLDKNGRVQYSEKQEIPIDRLPSATLFK